MDIEFKNFDTGKKIKLSSDKSLIIVYGKNGSGKTTLSRQKLFDKRFVFNEDFIFSNVYNISEDGASQTVKTKENFSGLWLGEDIVKIRKEITNILAIEKKLKDEYQQEQNKLNDFFMKHQIPIVLQNKLNELDDKDFKIDINKIAEQRTSYITTHNFKSNVDSKEKFIEKLTYLKKNDYTPLIMHTENDIEEEIRCIERLKNMNVDGIMVLATGSTKEYEEAVKKLKIPILFLGQRFPGENSVINDDYNAGYAVGNYIGQRKFKEIYMLWVPEDDPAVGGERRHGVIDGLMSCEKKPKEVIETTFFYENAIENVQKFVDHMKTPAAVVCATDRIAFGVYKVMSEKGIRIPEEVSVVGFGDYEAGELLQPPLTTVKFDWKNWGEISAESMIQMILGKPVSPLQVNPYKIIERKSVKEN